MTTDLKPIYQAATEDAAADALEAFAATWGAKYPTVVKSWRQNGAELVTFFRYPAALRKVIYTSRATTANCAK